MPAVATAGHYRRWMVPSSVNKGREYRIRKRLREQTCRRNGWVDSALEKKAHCASYREPFAIVSILWLNCRKNLSWQSPNRSDYQRIFRSVHRIVRRGNIPQQTLFQRLRAAWHGRHPQLL